MNGFNVRDTLLAAILALPNGAAAATSTAVDLTESAAGDFVADGEFLLTAPALTTTQQPDAKTLTYDILHSDNADLSSPVVIAPGILVQTGAGGVGAAAATFRWKPPTNVKRYVGLKATGSASGNASAANATLEWLS